MKRYLQVGKILNTHGLNGEVKVRPLTDDPKRFDFLKKVFLVPKDSVGDDLVLRSNFLEIQKCRYFQDKIIVKFDEVNTIEEAQKIKEHYLVIHRENAISLPQDTHFICDLIDCEVFDREGNQLGMLREVIQTGSNDVYIVKREGKKDLLLPALKSVVDSIDIIDKKIIVEVPKGLP